MLRGLGRSGSTSTSVSGTAVRASTASSLISIAIPSTTTKLASTTAATAAKRAAWQIPTTPTPSTFAVRATRLAATSHSAWIQRARTASFLRLHRPARPTSALSFGRPHRSLLEGRRRHRLLLLRSSHPWHLRKRLHRHRPRGCPRNLRMLQPLCSVPARTRPFLGRHLQIQRLRPRRRQLHHQRRRQLHHRRRRQLPHRQRLPLPKKTLRMVTPWR
mmetsp:Transcript_7774/g.29162  ORF Transcript_7774/g.29162 Transcript_7774/m.29162 type:complete len:217 (-) Transcript_7774:1668-2318(-)